KEVEPLKMPDHKSTRAGVVTPSSGRNRGMIGVSMLNDIVMTNWIPTMVQSVHCQVDWRSEESSGGSAAMTQTCCTGRSVRQVCGTNCVEGADCRTASLP